MKKYSLYLDSKFIDQLHGAVTACADGKWGIKKSKTGPDLTPVAYDGAEKLIECMRDASKLAKQWVDKQIGE